MSVGPKVGSSIGNLMKNLLFELFGIVDHLDMLVAKRQLRKPLYSLVLESICRSALLRHPLLRKIKRQKQKVFYETKMQELDV